MSEGKTSIAWPQWVLNELANAIYKADEELADEPTESLPFAMLNEPARLGYFAMARAALQWIEDQGWVRMAK